MEVPRRCIGLGKMEHSNGSGRGRRVERGPVWSLCDIENNENQKINARPRELAPQGGPKADLARADSFPISTAFHCHFASQDRKASPKKAGGAVNKRPLNKQARKTGPPGPVVRDIGQFATHNSGFEFRGFLSMECGQKSAEPHL